MDLSSLFHECESRTHVLGYLDVTWRKHLGESTLVRSTLIERFSIWIIIYVQFRVAIISIIIKRKLVISQLISLAFCIEVENDHHNTNTGMTNLPDIPKFAFGTAFNISENNKKDQQSFKGLLQNAIQLGCRHVDCAPLYGTQSLVGQTLDEAVGLINRSELFITSKLPVNMMREEYIEKSLQQTLRDLRITYLDLFLIHAPFSTVYIDDIDSFPVDGEGNLMIDEQEGLLEECWRKLVHLKRTGSCKYIGLSNVNLRQLYRLNEIHQVDVVQNEFHIYNQDRQFLDRCRDLGVHFEAYAALGCPPKAKLENKPNFMDDPVLRRIANEKNLSKVQVVIQWLQKQPLSYVIRSDNMEQLDENLKATGQGILSARDLIDLNSLNENARLYKYENYIGITRHKEYPF